MNKLNLDLTYQLSTYFLHHYQLAWLKLLSINTEYYLAFLWILRNKRHILTRSEINEFYDVVKMNMNFIYLARAVENNSLIVLLYLLNDDQYLDINTGQSFARPLSIAASNGYLAIVKELVKHGADIHYDDDYAFRMAVKYMHTPVIKYLLSQGVNIYKYGNLVAEEAAKQGNLRLIMKMLFLAEYVNSKDGFIRLKNNILQQAAKGGNIDIVKYIIALGANISAEQGYALLLAARYGHLNVIEYLINKGINLNMVLVLAFAELGGQDEVVDYLNSLS